METAKKSLAASPALESYFQEIQQKVENSYQLAAAARKKGLDPEEEVPIPLAKNMAERVVGLISVVAPQIATAAIPQRIIELEQEYGFLDWRVGLKIAEEVATERFCAFATKEEAMEVGIRTGFAYLTLGIVSAPLEGFIGLKIKKRRDGGSYFALQYAGPIRAAGGTGQCISVIIADYVRLKMGYATYDPDQTEISRYIIEIQDYHERVTNLQYRPSEEELRFLLSHLPVEIDGEPTEQIAVSNYKDLPRIETNSIRGGMALVLAEGLSQKAPKVWKNIAKWGSTFGLDWSWLKEFLALKEKVHAKDATKDEKESEKKKVLPNTTYLMDLVAGRPILTHPLAAGGFRLRYGRSRTCGMYAIGVHPATMAVLDKYIAIGTQLKVERPRKSASVTVCETIDGPLVRLKNGSVLFLKNEQESRPVLNEIESILFLGDMLVNYGDFADSGHSLVPAGYCPEWWALEVEKALGAPLSAAAFSEKARQLSIPEDRFRGFLEQPLLFFPSWPEALRISQLFHLPLHPQYTFYWRLISGPELLQLRSFVQSGKVKKENGVVQKIILFYDESLAEHRQAKQLLESAGIPHRMITRETLLLQNEEAEALAFCLSLGQRNSSDEEEKLRSAAVGKDGLEMISLFCPLPLRDKAGTFIGARMGRPEKAKMRQLTGSPQCMFPIGEEGDRLRSFQAALKAGKVRSAFPSYFCIACKKEMIYSRCEECGEPCQKWYQCRICGRVEKEACPHGLAKPYKNMELPIQYYFSKALERLGERVYPDLIKGIRGTSNKNHVVEHLAKGILRAKHGVYVNKDGTTRYDCTELPITHFKPKEVGTSVEKLRDLGYIQDIFGSELSAENQILELRPQDVILPGFNSLDESASQVLTRVAAFIDDLLVRFYKLPPFYSLKKPQDLVGHLVVGLAPHISVGLVGRIIGFSETQGLFAHPMFHAGMRRDCLVYGTTVPIFDGKHWSMQQIGAFVTGQKPRQTIDTFGTKGKKIEGYHTFGYNPETGKLQVVPICEVTKHRPTKICLIRTENGREIETTLEHKFYVKQGQTIVEKQAKALQPGDRCLVPHFFPDISESSIKKIVIPTVYLRDDLMASGVDVLMRKSIASHRIPFCKQYYLSRYRLRNYLQRKRWPASLVRQVLGDVPHNTSVSIKRDTVQLPSSISLAKDVLWLIGLYIAEGFSRKKVSSKGYYQISFAACELFIRKKVKRTCLKYFNLLPSRETTDALIYSSKLFYLFFTEFLPCGSFAQEKQIPPVLLSLPKNRLRYLLQGYFDGDGSTDRGALRVSCDTVSPLLIDSLYFALSRYGIYFRKYESTRLPGKRVQQFYIKKNRKIPSFTATKLTIPSTYCGRFAKEVGFSLPRKQRVLQANCRQRNIRGTKVEHNDSFTFLRIKEIFFSQEKKETYCLNVGKTHNFIANNFLVHNCDGDEACVMLIMDALLNFSRQYLPEKRGAKTMDAALVLTSILNPAEVDDQVLQMDVAWKYPLELYEAALDLKSPSEVKSNGRKVEQLADRLGKPEQYEHWGFTHSVDNINRGIQCSAYKTLPSMGEKLFGQMELARKIRAVNLDDVAKLVIQKHFLRDIKGNLRKFSTQQFRCVKCNTKYRRPPLWGKCLNCNGKLLFTITEGSVVKYLGFSLALAEKYDFSPYLKQTLQVLQLNIEKIFGKEKEKQVGLGTFL